MMSTGASWPRTMLTTKNAAAAINHQYVPVCQMIQNRPTLSAMPSAIVSTLLSDQLRSQRRSD